MSSRNFKQKQNKEKKTNQYDQRHRYRFENCLSISRLGPMLNSNVNRTSFVNAVHSISFDAYSAVDLFETLQSQIKSFSIYNYGVIR